MAAPFRGRAFRLLRDVTGAALKASSRENTRSQSNELRNARMVLSVNGPMQLGPVDISVWR